MRSSRFSALRHPQFLRFWLASFSSVGATQLQIMGLGWLVYELSGSALALGYLSGASGLPAILTSLFGGALADRWDKRLLLIITCSLTALLLSLLTWLDFSGQATVWNVILIAGVISVITGFDWPARNAIFPYLIERENMMSAVSLTTVIWQSTRMVMPALGGIIIAVFDTWVLFACCAAGFFAMCLVLTTLRVHRPVVDLSHVSSTLGQIAEGVRFIVTERTFLILMTLSYSLFFFAGSYMQLMPAFADLLDVAEQGYGYLLSAGGMGAILGTVLSGSLQDSHRLGRAMLLSAAVACGFVYLFAAVSWSGLPGAYFMALGSAFCAAVFISIFMITSTTVLQLEVPDRLRGRVMGLHTVTYNLATLGGLFSGAIASFTHVSAAIAIAVSLFLVYLVWVMITQTGIREIDGSQLTMRGS